MKVSRDISRMAREAGPLTATPFDEWCERFAALVAAHEREQCARLCDSWLHGDGSDCAEAIRARGAA